MEARRSSEMSTGQLQRTKGRGMTYGAACYSRTHSNGRTSQGRMSSRAERNRGTRMLIPCRSFCSRLGELRMIWIRAWPRQDYQRERDGITASEDEVKRWLSHLWVIVQAHGHGVIEPSQVGWEEGLSTRLGGEDGAKGSKRLCSSRLKVPGVESGVGVYRELCQHGPGASTATLHCVCWGSGHQSYWILTP